MRQLLSRLEIFQHVLGFFSILPAHIPFVTEFFKFSRLNDGRFSLKLTDVYPQLHDRTAVHDFDPHYIYHTAWAARVVAKIKPKVHVDIASSLYFAVIASAFVKVKFYDYRPAQLELSGLSSGSADLTKLLFKTNSLSSVSCMHTLEHIGLGRYGDPLDSQGDLKAMKELQRVVKTGGSLLVVVPMGKPRIMFNAHRIYSYEQIISYFDHMKLHEFSLIPDGPDAQLINQAKPSLVKKQSYACGCFWFKKL